MIRTRDIHHGAGGSAMSWCVTSHHLLRMSGALNDTKIFGGLLGLQQELKFCFETASVGRSRFLTATANAHF
jgi:hypothetical protein